MVTKYIYIYICIYKNVKLILVLFYLEITTPKETGYNVLSSKFYGYIALLEKSLNRISISSFLVILKYFNEILSFLNEILSTFIVDINSIQLNIEKINIQKIKIMIDKSIEDLKYLIELLDALIIDLFDYNISLSISASNLEKKYPNICINLKGIHTDFKDWLILLIKQILNTERPPSLPGIMIMNDESVKITMNCFDSNIRTK